METKKIMQKMKLPMILVVFWLISQSGWAIAVVGYNLTATNLNTSGIGVNPAGTRSITISGISGSVSASNGYWCSGWNSAGSDAYVTSVFSAAGYIQLTGSFQMKANSTGPTALKVQWSTNGSSWTDAPMTLSGGGNVSETSLTTSYQTYNFTLPTSLNGASSIYIRWVQVSVGTFLGNVGLTSVSIGGNAFAAPQTQATGISIIAVSSHSIKIGCTNGNGTHRIIKIRRDNNFDATPPAANDDVVGNTNYSGVGEQIIYNGTGSQVTVTTTPETTEVFWFAVYEYNKMGSLTLYNTVLPGETDKNQHKCQLEVIINPTSANIRLVKATLGATITPSVNDIIERGIIWSTTSPVDDSGNYISESIDGTDGRASDGHGIFTISGDGWPSDATGITVPRGTTIYFKGYAINASGQIMSEESSFTNVPIFTGTATWETAARWNVQEVPGANGDATYGSVEDSPFIDGTCTLSASNSVTNLTINSGKSLAINTATNMTVNGTLTNNAGNSGILIKSAADVANGSLIWPEGNDPVTGTVEMWSKTYTDANYHWQYFGIPVTGTTFASTFSGTGVRVRKYDETNHDATGNNVGLWKPSGTGNSYSGTDALVPVDGYEVTQPSAKKYSFSGTLNHSNVNKTLAYTVSADWKGQHILANPFTAALDISKLTFGAGTENNVYLYNAGSLAEWTAASGASTDGTSPGQYTVSNGEFAGTLGTPKQIPSMQGFLVNVTSTSSFGMPLSALISNSIVQRAPAVSNKVGTRIDVVGTKYADKMWIFTESTATRSYDKGFDGPKLLGSALTPQLYAMESDGIYQIDAVKDINNTQLGFQAGSEKNLKLVFTHQNSELYSKIYLVDLVANKTVDVTASGSEYAFTSEATPTAVNRFKIISTTEVTTSTNNIKNDDLRIMNQDNKLIIDNKLADNGTLQIFDLAGKLQTSFHFDGNAISTLNSTLQKGIYVARMSAGSYSISKSLIIK